MSQTNIGSGGTDGFSNTVGGRNVFGTRGVWGAHSGARRRIVLLDTKRSKGIRGNEVLRGEWDSVLRTDLPWTSWER